MVSFEGFGFRATGTVALVIVTGILLQYLNIQPRIGEISIILGVGIAILLAFLELIHRAYEYFH